MTTIEFEKYVRQGLGRAVLLLRAEADKSPFYDMVMYAATHNTCYDWQCEDNRGYYVAELIRCFDDPGQLINTVITKADEMTEQSGKFEDFGHYRKMLRFFASDGNIAAFEALLNIYSKLLERMKKHTKQFDIIDIELFNYNDICCDIAITSEGKRLGSIFSDIGSILSQDESYDIYDFENFISNTRWQLKKEIFESALEKARDKNAGTDRFYTEYKAMCPMVKRSKKAEIPLDFDEILRTLRSGGELVNTYMVIENATAVQLAEFAELAVAETNVKKKTGLLNIFGSNIRRYPLSPLPLIDAAKIYESIVAEKCFTDEIYHLGVTLFRVLSQLHTPEVREYGLDLIRRGMIWHGFALWAHNYLAEDREKFIEFVKNVPDSFGKNDISNRIHSEVIHMFFDGIPDAPSELLPYIYETTYNSSCRYKAICCMENLGIMTDAMREECRFDSCWETRDRYCSYDNNKTK